MKLRQVTTQPLLLKDFRGLIIHLIVLPYLHPHMVTGLHNSLVYLGQTCASAANPLHHMDGEYAVLRGDWEARMGVGHV